MIVIYTQDATYIKPTADAALSILNSIYGPKLAQEAYNTIRNARVGTTYRKYGGPRIEVVSRERAEWIREKRKISKQLWKLLPTSITQTRTAYLTP